MNIYDKKQVECKKCGRVIGEVQYDSEIVFPQCGYCINGKQETKNYIENSLKNYGGVDG